MFHSFCGRLAFVFSVAVLLTACVPNRSQSVATIAPPPPSLAELNAAPDYGQKPTPVPPVVTPTATPDANGNLPTPTKEEIQAQLAERQHQLIANMDTCLLKKEGGLYASHEESAKCKNFAVERAAARTGYPWPDLVSSLDTLRLQLAADVDAKKTTQRAADASLAEKLTDLTTQEINRKSQYAAMNAQQQQVLAAQQMARAQAMSAMAQQQSAQAQAQMAARPVFVQPAQVAPVTNNSIHCTTMPGGAPGYSNTNCY